MKASSFDRTKLNGHAVTLIAANGDIGAALWRLRASAPDPDPPRHRTRSTSPTRRSCRCGCSTIGTISIGTVERGYAGPSLWDWASLPNDRSALLGLCSRQCLDRHQRRRPQQRQRRPANPHARISAEGRGARRRLPALWHPRLSLGPLQRPMRDRRACRPRTRWTRAYALVARQGGRDLSAHPRLRRLPRQSQFRRPAGAAGLQAHPGGRRQHASPMRSRRIGGTVFWRAFVYGNSKEDRAKQAYDEFKPLDGKFRGNVIVQVKNGPIDFQPREPFHPLFGQMPHTNVGDSKCSSRKRISRPERRRRLTSRRCGRRCCDAGHLLAALRNAGQGDHRGDGGRVEYRQRPQLDRPPISTRRTGMRSAGSRGTRRCRRERSPTSGRG